MKIKLSILIPYNDLTEEKKKQWLELKKYTNPLYDEKNVILLNYITEKKNNITYHRIDQKNKEVHDLCDIFLQYMDDYNFVVNFGEKWLENSIKNLCNGYDHVENYKNLLKTDKYKIIDSLLILISIDDIIDIPLYKTREEEEIAFNLKRQNYKKFYLFCGQMSNFQTRSLLIPFDLFPEKRKEQWQKIKTFSNNDYNIPNLVIQNIIWNDNVGEIDSKDEELSELCNIFMNVADSFDGYRVYGDDDDREWIKYSYSNLCGGFNHIKNYQSLLKLTNYDGRNIEIIDNILLLESENGIVKAPLFDTVSEMMYETYFKKNM